MEKSAEVVTPKNKLRSLGLKRSIQRTLAPNTPQSDARISYKSLQNEEAITTSPSTPCLPHTASGACTTTKCSLSLSRKVRDNYKKKKLEFAVPQPDPDKDSQYEEMTPNCSSEEQTRLKDLLQQIKCKETQIQAHRNHQQKVKELNALIDIWKEGFKASLEELSSRIEPKMETEELIARLNIPTEMIQYT